DFSQTLCGQGTETISHQNTMREKPRLRSTKKTSGLRKHASRFPRLQRSRQVTRKGNCLGPFLTILPLFSPNRHLFQQASQATPQSKHSHTGRLERRSGTTNPIESNCASSLC